MDGEQWSVADLNVLERFYPAEGAEGMARILHTHSIDSIREQASRMGLEHYAARPDRTLVPWQGMWERVGQFVWRRFHHIDRITIQRRRNEQGQPTHRWEVRIEVLPYGDQKIGCIQVAMTPIEAAYLAANQMETSLYKN